MYENEIVYVEILTVESGESSRVTLPGKKISRLSLSWSLDERFFAYADAANESSDATQIRILRLDDGASFTVMNGLSQAWPVGWGNEGRSLTFISDHEGAKDLWSQPLSRKGEPEGNPERLTTGLGIRRAAFSADRTKLVYSRGQIVTNVFRVPLLPGRPATWENAEQLTFDEANVEFIDISPDGTQLLLQSDRRGNPDIWLLPIGGVMQRITTDPSPDWAPRWSPDGRSIAFYAYRSGNREIWVRPIGKGAARQLTRGERESVMPSWSPDGREIVFMSNDIPYNL